MSSLKIFQQLQVLDHAEMLRMLVFLQSPFHNSNKKLTALFQLLRPHHPDFESRTMTEEKIFAKLYPGKPFNQQMLRNLMTKLTQMTERFLMQIQLEKEDSEQEKLLLRAYAERPDCYSIFSKKAEKLKSKLRSDSSGNAQRELDFFQLEQQVFEHPLTQKFKLPPERLDSAMQHLDRFYLLEKLMLGVEMRTREFIFEEHYDIRHWDGLLAHAEQEAEQSPLVAAQLNMVRLLLPDGEQAYWPLKNQLLNHRDDLNFRVQQNVFGCLVNFAIRNGNRGSLTFQRENLELYQFGLPHGMLHAEGVLGDMTFLNIVKLATKLREFDWVEQFLDDYAADLDPALAQTVITFSKAFLFFRLGHAQSTLDQLESFEPENEFYKVEWRELMLKARYDLALTDPTLWPVVISEASSFEKLMARNRKLSPFHIAKQKNFAMAVRLMATEQLENQGFPSQRLLQKIDLPERFTAWLWLMKKLGKE